jgi:FixJ family two-component response regulator
MAKATTPTVFVIDDDALLREAIRALLVSVGHNVETFSSVEEFTIGRDKTRTSCLVLDVRLPGISGLEFQKLLFASGDPIPTIFMSGHGDIPMAVQAIKGGGLEFLIKPFRDQELLDAVQTALRRDQERRDAEHLLSEVTERYSSLTVREREIMGFVVRGHINKQIAAATCLSEVTVKIHRGQVMRKMSAGSLPDLVRMADKLEKANIWRR